MCFSLAASFGAAAILVIAGIASIVKARQQKQLLFAAIPIVFALQQAAEALIWLTARNITLNTLKTELTYFFLFVAESVWPVWVPLSLLLMERSKIRKTILAGLFIVGLFTSVYLAFYLLTYGVEARVLNCNILYMQHLRSPYVVLTSIPYLLAVITPFFVSGVKGMRWPGIFILASFAVTKVFGSYQLFSVWSFYAVLISIIIYYQISRRSIQPE
jgi:hypothetical protein